MTGETLKTLCTTILDEVEIDDVSFYQYLNVAKTKLEEKRLWQYLKKLNSSNTVPSGNNYTTGITLPSDFAEDFKVMIGTDTEYLPIPFEEQHKFRNSSLHYYIDWANLAIYFTGNVKGGTLYLYYKRFTDDITSSTSPVFPARFHPLLAYYVAGYFQAGVDADDIFARMSPENKMAAMQLQDAMEMWDSNIAMRAQNNQIGVADSDPGIDLSQM